MSDLITEYLGGAHRLDPAPNNMIVQSIHNHVMEALAAAAFSVLLVVEAVPYLPIKKMITRQINGMNNCPLSIV